MALPDAVSKHDATHVWLSVGGNDLIFNYALRGDVEQIFADVEGDMITILDTLFEVHPYVKVVMFAYDFPNFQSSFCFVRGTINSNILIYFLSSVSYRGSCCSAA